MTSIADYALLGDCQGAALVSVAGSVDWWCPARFDAPSVFARLLDPGGGHWWIRPRAEHTVTRRYIEGSMVVETEFTTDSGVLRLTDALALGVGERGHQIGYASPHVLLRHVETVQGTVEVEVEVAARLEYGLITPQLRSTPRGVEMSAGADRLTLACDRPLDIGDDRVTGRFTLGEGDSAVFALDHRHYSEAAFKTLKYAPVFPDRFGSLADARAFSEDFFAYYNHQHRHSGIGWHTPASVHHGTADQIRVRRAATLDVAYTANPDRFTRPPEPPRLPDTAWINQPSGEALIQTC